MKRGLYIGRFQPLHLGHLAVIDEMQQAQDLDELVIGIGSAQYSYQERNPFTVAEREAMLRSSITHVKPITLVSLEDQHENTRWLAYLHAKVPEFKVVYTGNPLVGQILGECGYEIRAPRAQYAFCATDVRTAMASGSLWTSYVPEGTKHVLNSINGAERLRTIYQQLRRTS